MKKLKSDDNILDRLSELPDSLILEILSLVDIRDVVRTTLLSKRWKDFWVTIPCLKFKYLGRYVVKSSNFRRDLKKFRNFVNRILTRWRGTHLREFSIFFLSDSESGASLAMDMALWVQFATERKVQDLCVEFHCGVPEYCPPQCLYECSSITKLSLYCCNLQSCGNVKWDGLTTLKLSDCVFSEDVMNQVFSSSPQLQDFTISCYQNMSIRSSSLKKLSIDYYDFNPTMLTIWAPNLQVLKYSGSAAIEFLLTDISSLTEVHLGFPGSWDVSVKEALCQILPVIQHVVSVQLSTPCIEVLRDIKGNDSISPLLNVKLLTIDCWSSIELSDIVGLLECFPKLKTLIIDWRSLGEQFKFDAENYTESEANILKSNLLELRTVVITWYVYEPSFFEFTGFLLKHASMIEKMVIRKGRNNEIDLGDMYQASQKLVSLQRSFPSVELSLLLKVKMHRFCCELVLNLWQVYKLGSLLKSTF